MADTIPAVSNQSAVITRNHNVDLRVTRVWQHTHEPTRLHYMISDEVTKATRHLYEDEGSALYRMLQAAIDHG